MSKASASTGMLLDGAQMSLSALVAGTMGFLKERDIPIQEWVSYIGERFADSLADLKGEPAENTLKHLLELEILPMGAELISMEAKGDKAEAVLTTLPGSAVLEKFGTTPRELMRGFGVTQKEFESILDMYQPAANTIGLQFSHRSKNGQIFLTLARASAPRKTARKQAGDAEQNELEVVNSLLANFEHEFGGDGAADEEIEEAVNEETEAM